MAKRTFAIVAVFAALLSVTLSVQAQDSDYYWTGARDNTYYFAANWNYNGQPYEGVYVESRDDYFLDSFTPSFTKNAFILTTNGTVNVDWSNFGVASLTIGNGIGGEGNTATVSRGNAELKTRLTLNKGGSATFGTFTISDNSGTPAALTMNGGTLTTGALTVNSGASITFNDGSYTLSAASGADSINNGTITLTGGSFEITAGKSFRVGGNNANAKLSINGGTFTTPSSTPTYVATSTNGTIEQTNGTATFNGALILGWGNNSGTYNLSGGTLNTTGDAGLWNQNDSGVSTFNVTGGQANFNTFVIGLHEPNKTDNALANVFNLNAGEVNTTGAFTVRKTGILNVSQTAQNAGGNGVLKANAIEINASGVLNLSSGTINLGSGGITSSDNAYAINLSGGTLGTNGASWSSALNAALSNTTTFSPGEGQMITWSGVLSGNGGITKTGAGDLKITAGDSGQAYTGGTTVSAGTLYLTGNNRGYSSVGTGDVTINSGAAVVAQSHNVFGSGDGSAMPNVIINGGSLTPNQYLHMKSLEINSGTVNSHGTSGDGLDFSNRNGTITSTGASSIASAIKNSSTLTIDVEDSELTVSGVLTGSGSISKNGDGTLKLSGTNTFSGGITVNAGKLLITGASTGTGTTTNNNALIEFAIDSGTVSITNTVDNLTNGGKTIKTGAGTLSTNNWISGQVEVQEGTLKLTNGFGSGKRFNGTITIAQGALLDCAAKDTLGYGSANTVMKIYGTMNSSVDNETLNNTELHMYGGTAKATSGSTFDILNAPNETNIGVKFYSYALTGATAEAPTVSTISPTLLLRHNGTLPIDTAANSQLNLTGEITGWYNNTTQYNCSITKLGVGTLEISANNPKYNGTTTISAGTLKLSGAGTLGTGSVTNNATLEFAQTGAQSFSNVISGTGAVIKSGAGTVTLSGANTYTGATTISAGTLEVSNNFTSSSSLAGSGTLKLSGNQKYFDIGNASEFTGTVQVFDTGISGHSRVYLAGANGTTSTNIDLSNATVEINGNTSGKFSELTFFKGGSTLTVGTLNGNKCGRIINLDSSSDAAYNNLTVSSGTFAGQIGREDASGSTYAYVNKINLNKVGNGTFTFSGIPYYFGETNIQGGVLKFVNDNTSSNKLFNRSNALKGSGTLQVVGNTDNWVLFAINANASSPQEFSGLLDVSGNFAFNQSANLGNATLHVAEDSYATMHGGNTKNLTVKELNTESGSKVRISHASPGSGNFATLTVGSGTVNGDLGEIANNAYYNWVKLNKVSDGSEDGGRLTLAGAFLYTGETTVSGGVLELTGAAVSANGPVTVGDNGTLIYNLAEGQSKLLTIDNSNKIVSTGTVEKTGAGTLQIYAASAGQVDAAHFLVSSGRLDMKGFFKGSLEVKSAATLSPGNSVGTLMVDGTFSLDSGAMLLLEVGKNEQGEIVTDQLVLNEINGETTFAQGSIINIVLNPASGLQGGDSFTDLLFITTSSEEAAMSIIDAVQNATISYNFPDFEIRRVGNNILLSGTLDPNTVPEPSTWALLVLGVAGLMYWRKKK